MDIFVTVVTLYPSAGSWEFYLDGIPVDIIIDPFFFIYNLPGPGNYVLQVVDVNGCSSPDISIIVTNLTDITINYLASSGEYLSLNISGEKILDELNWKDYSDVADVIFIDKNNQITTSESVGLTISKSKKSKATFF